MPKSDRSCVTIVLDKLFRCLRHRFERSLYIPPLSTLLITFISFNPPLSLRGTELHRVARLCDEMDEEIGKLCGVGSRNAVSDQYRFTHKTYFAGNGGAITVDYCTSSEQLQVSLQPFLEEDFVGFDCEWKPFEKQTTEIKVPRAPRIQSTYNGCSCFRL